MGRPIVLSNNSLFVGLDSHGLVNDFYYPYVGQENLTDARSMHHKIGVWCNNQFSWLDQGDWQTTLRTENEALIGSVHYTSENLQLEITTEDTVLPNMDTFLRSLRITNTSDKPSEVRLFMHQVFRISQNGRADTACYVPEGRYILDYKGRCTLGIGGKTDKDIPFDQFAVGNFGIEGKSGTFMDAEDGELSGNLVEHGGVDSVIRFTLDIGPGQERSATYWINAASSQAELHIMQETLQDASISELFANARHHWAAWIQPALPKLAGMPDEQRTAVQKSLFIIKAHTDSGGAVLASGDSTIFNYGRDYYCYCWPRDAAYALWPLIRLGIYDEARQFFAFARDTMHKDGYLLHKYQPDKSIGSTWHPLQHNRHAELAIQEDETASVLRLMAEYYEFTKDAEFLDTFYDSFIQPCTDFLASYIDQQTALPHASYDLWEQKFITSTYTVCTVISALLASATLAKVRGNTEDARTWEETAFSIQAHLGAFYHPDGYLRKGFTLLDSGDLQFDDTLDISNLYGPYMFTKLGADNPMIANTAAVVEQRLYNSSPIGGVIRYEHDGYFLSKQQYKGNPWIVCTAWLAQYHMFAGNNDKAHELLGWILDRQESTGSLSEQYDAETAEPVSVQPLVWSHAELINTVLDLHSIK